MVTKVSAINAKHGPFDALFVLGDFFKPCSDSSQTLSDDEDALLKGELKLPMATYVLHPPSQVHSTVQALFATSSLSNGAKSDEEPHKLCDRLYTLGKGNVCLVKPEASHVGLRVAALGGRWGASQWASGAEDGDDTTSMTSSSVAGLMTQPSFREASTSALKLEQEPTSLAEARAQAAARASMLQAQADESEAMANRPPIDVLLTNAWPSGITLLSNAEKLPHATSRMWGAPPCATLARAGQPRYHFALAPGSTGDVDDDSQSTGIVGLDGTEEGKELRATGSFWEREPYRNMRPSHPYNAATRFVSLARFANAKKARWFMALNVVPASAIPASEAYKTAPKISNMTPSPFGQASSGPPKPQPDGARTKINKRQQDQMESGPNFRWSEGGKGGKRPRAAGLPSKPNVDLPPRKKPLVIPVGPQDCWFCLGNPQCAKHLIVAVGSACYIAMPKGQLPPTTGDALSPVPGGGHVLIIPINHFPSLLAAAPETSLPVQQEADAWRAALGACYASFGARPLAWEVCRTSGTRAGHMQTQVVPVPENLCGPKLEAVFRHAAKENGYEFIEDPEEVKSVLKISQQEAERQQRGDYFRLDLPPASDGAEAKTWVMLLQGKRFTLQFAR